MMKIEDEWKILVGMANRRLSQGRGTISDEALADVGTAINYILERVRVDEKGNVSLGAPIPGSLENALKFGR